VVLIEHAPGGLQVCIVVQEAVRIEEYQLAAHRELDSAIAGTRRPRISIQPMQRDRRAAPQRLHGLLDLRKSIFSRCVVDHQDLELETGLLAGQAFEE
jgi:hypothetical protein